MCGAVAIVAPDATVVRVTIVHEATCDFLRAVECGRARLWVEANSYPITLTTIAGAA